MAVCSFICNDCASNFKQKRVFFSNFMLIAGKKQGFLLGGCNLTLTFAIHF